ncbi:JmjC domain-containing protein F [Ceratocystis fimbriata CBS 114723]|uniref:JmjC domain-containing protein F n=1 Tax=Ceratocystis fimbriata CBS 114723 TaxID=1035309 RepID=A0A2C5XKI0_9PEZI|nr:JmjC domain-containing protein F [Ceratocystis fimbriata CBS 114723]
MVISTLLEECLTASSAIASELLAACAEPSLLSSQDCPLELSGCPFPVVRLLQRQAALIVTIHNAAVLGSGLAFSDNLDVTRVRVEHEQQMLLQRRLTDILEIATAEFYARPFSAVLDGWRRVYADTRILMFHVRLLNSPLVTSRRDSNMDEAINDVEKTVDALVETLDMAIIVAGGNPVKARNKKWMNWVLRLLEDATQEAIGARENANSDERPTKKMRTGINDSNDDEGTWADYPMFCSHEAFTPPVVNPIPRLSDYSVGAFESYLTTTSPEDLAPAIFTDLANYWPAMTSRPWSKPAYLLQSTFGGRRLVPVEIGRSYIDANWTQKILPFRTFLSEFIQNTSESLRSKPLGQSSIYRRGYLAQHDLLAQIPSLRADVAIPDLCWAEPPLASPASAHSDPRLNAWFGPAGTITPLHTDSTHNILVQVVGRKYVRLYHPKYSNVLRPRPPENGIDMSNTASVDVGVEEGWDTELEAESDENTEQDHAQSLHGEPKVAFHETEYWDCILGPGDSLYIPYGWWHYVRSLSTSFSVSFWWA